MKKEIITIAGKPGSGKSSTAKGVAQRLGYEHFSSGDIFRKVAADHGWSIEEINKQAEHNPNIDYELDEKIRLLNEKNQLVIDSRTAFHWIPNSFKVYLDLNQKIAAERVFVHMQEQGRKSQSAESAEEVYRKTLERYESENKRFKKLYDLDPTNTDQYDLVINTGDHPLEEVIQTVLTSYKNWLES